MNKGVPGEEDEEQKPGGLCMYDLGGEEEFRVVGV